MYTRILVAIDGSALTERILTHAWELARRLAATVRLVHVVDTGWLDLGMELGVDTSELSHARRAAGEKLLADALASARAAGLTAETRLLEMATPTDHIGALISREAADWPADLVLVGTHGRRRLERMLLGSTAEGVARLSPAPVLLVPF